MKPQKSIALLVFVAVVVAEACSSSTMPTGLPHAATTPETTGRTITVSGVVREPGDRVLPGVTVKSSSGAFTTTDGAGHFVLESIPAFSKITLELAGYRAVGNWQPILDVELALLMVPDLKITAGDTVTSTVYWDDQPLTTTDDVACTPFQCPPTLLGPGRIIEVQCPRKGWLRTSIRPIGIEANPLTEWIQNSEASFTAVRAGEVVEVGVVLVGPHPGSAQAFELSTWIE